MHPLFEIPANFSELDDDALRSFIESSVEIATRVGDNPSEFLADGRTQEALFAEMTAGVAAIREARSVLKSRETPVAEGEVETAAVEAEAETPEIDADAFAELGRAAADEPEAEVETEVETPAEDEPLAAASEHTLVMNVDTSAVGPAIAEAISAGIAAATESATEAVTAAAPARRRLPLGRSRAAEPKQDKGELVPLTAAAPNLGPSIGEEIDSTALAKMMIKRRGEFGQIAPGTRGDKVTLAKADWSGLYPDERILDGQIGENWEKIESVVASADIRSNFEQRRNIDASMTASGGLCAPVTPYYQLAMLSVADRPVRAALAAFNADRGGIKFARPAGLTAIQDGVGIKLESEDAAGGTIAVKTCQVIDCPQFEEVDVDIVYHCLQLGNLTQRTFPELVAQWNDLVMAAHARAAESKLLTGIDDASTSVTAAALGLGASATLPSQILAAANGMRSRHRMRMDTVLRVMLPAWVLDLLVSDVYRSQFDRFEMSRDQFVGLLRDGNVEPSFYLDGADGAGQVFGTQSAADLLPFPAEIRWYLYPEGSFLYLDGGTLELGLVRDSVLNATNDYQIFGETFENVAFVGLESLAVTTAVCDNGAVSAPAEAPTCPIDYAG